MSRRKVRGLTRTGRQVSEDPDLDNLLSNLSPEEMEELQKEVSTVPDPDPSEIIIVEQTDLNQSTSNKCDSNLPNHNNESRTGLQRNLSIEGGPKRESRKQEYLRKMGLSQEKTISKEGGLQGQQSISTQNETFKQEEDIKVHITQATQGSKDVKVGQSKRDDGNEKKSSVKEKQQNDVYKVKERREVKESCSKTKELIAKLQDKKEDCKERDRREESQKKESGDKTKEMISRLQGKQERVEKKESKTKGFVSKLEEKQNQVTERKTDESKNSDKNERIDKQQDLDKFNDKDVIQKDVGKHTISTDEENTNVKDKEFIETQEHETVKKDKEMIKGKERLRMTSLEGMEIQKGSEIKNENRNPSHDEYMSNCVTERNSKNVNKEEEDEDESASMFAEDLERIRNNDPRMTELNVNNSEVIKVRTLIQFAEALRNNTHIKTLALANCRADDHVAYAIAGTLRNNKTITSINMDSNLLTSKGIMAIVQALQYNCTVTELRFHNQRHICGGKTEMEMTKILKENTTLLKLGYHFELAGPRMTMTNILSRNMDRQRQKRLQEQKQAQAQGNVDKKGLLEVPKSSFNKGSPRNSPKPSPVQSPKLNPKTPKGTCGPPPPPGVFPPPPPPPNLDADFVKNSLTPVSQRKHVDRSGGRGASLNSRDQLLASIRDANIKQLKKVALPKLLQ